MLYRDKVLAIARAELGVTEHPPGSNSGPRVMEYQAATTLRGTGWPWCDAFVAWCFKRAGLPLKDPTASTVQSLRDAVASHTRISKPYPGCIVLYDFPGGDVVDHTGIVEKVLADGSIMAIEGNTSSGDSGSQSNGGGVFRRHRARSLCRAFYHVPGVLTVIPGSEPKDGGPKPSPAWWWKWADWRRSGRKGPRPADAPRLIPPWAWKRLVNFNRSHPVR